MLALRGPYFWKVTCSFIKKKWLLVQFQHTFNYSKRNFRSFSTSHSRKPSSPFNERRGSQILELVHDEIYLYISSTAATISIVLPHENVDGIPVPALFKDRPPDYHMFLMFILFAFLGAFSALVLQHKPRFGKFFRISAIASMLSALAIVLNAVALWFAGPLLKHIN